MNDCKHRVFRKHCAVCWWKWAHNMFKRFSNNPNDIIYDTRMDFYMENHSRRCECMKCSRDRRYKNVWK